MFQNDERKTTHSSTAVLQIQRKEHTIRNKLNKIKEKNTNTNNPIRNTQTQNNTTKTKCTQTQHENDNNETRMGNTKTPKQHPQNETQRHPKPVSGVS